MPMIVRRHGTPAESPAGEGIDDPALAAVIEAEAAPTPRPRKPRAKKPKDEAAAA